MMSCSGGWERWAGCCINPVIAGRKVHQVVGDRLTVRLRNNSRGRVGKTGVPAVSVTTARRKAN